MTAVQQLDVADLHRRVQDVYQLVADEPHRTYHFEMGPGLARRLGYPDDILEVIPLGALESFVGVGYFLDLGAIQAGERILDLGSGSGTDSFAAASLTGAKGEVTGVDMTGAQLPRRSGCAWPPALTTSTSWTGRIEDIPLADGSCDVVMSNRVIESLSADKTAVFADVASVLVPGRRLALADMVSERPLTEAITCDAELWALVRGAARSMTPRRDRAG